MLNYALEYAALGWHVFPVWWIDENGACACGKPDCTSPGKHPIPHRGCYAASTDAKILSGLWRNNPEANIGLHCGPSGIVALDLDLYKDVYLASEVEKLITPADEQTVTSLTGGGGVHLLYATTAAYSNSNKALPDGIDVRCWGAYIVLPPSNHESGGQYQWEDGYGPGEIPLAPVPPKLKALLDAIMEDRRRAKERAAQRTVEIAPEAETLADALSYIPNWSISDGEGGLTYQDWIGVLMAVHSVFPGDDGIDLIESWSPGTPGEVAAKFASFHSDGVTLGTVDHLARAHGWQGSFTDSYDGFSAVHSHIQIGHTITIEDPEEPADDAPDYPAWPFAVQDGCLVMFKKTKGKIDFEKLADLQARIIHEIIDENDERIYVIEGVGKRGGPFRKEISAADWGSPSRLKAALDAISSLDTVYAGSTEHLGSAIKNLSGGQVITRRYNRIGWRDGRFLIPGREPAGIEIKLDDKAAAYHLPGGADMGHAVTALDALMDGIGEYGTVVVAHALLGPLAALAGWRGDRYGLFLRGITGSMKTTTGRLAMALWGPRFASEQLFEKMGAHGGTANGIIGRAAEIGDLPWMLDNFKPNTQGRESAVALIHALMEGHTKSRQTRTGQNAKTTPLHCWPLMTGEDIPGTDTAALARLIIVDLESKHGEVPEGIAVATDLAGHLHAIGAAWLDLLEGPRGPAVVGMAKDVFDTARAQFAEHIRIHSPRAENILRSATNFALQSAVWSALAELEPIHDLIMGRMALHHQTLLDLAGSIERHTSDHLEANKFLAILGALMATGRVHVLPIGATSAPHGVPVIGWYDGESNLCLYPDLAIQAVETVNRDALNGMTKNSLYAQLKTLDALATVGRDGKSTVPLYDPVTGKRPRVLVLKSSALEEGESHMVTAEEIGL
jgi:putative DNA primase/helicase